MKVKMAQKTVTQFKYINPGDIFHFPETTVLRMKVVESVQNMVSSVVLETGELDVVPNDTMVVRLDVDTITLSKEG